MFDGYLSFGGIEIINAARTAAYVHNLSPAMPLVRRTDLYDTIREALGDEPYRSPFLDQADWVETRGTTGPEIVNPSHGFYGLYPLSIDGIGDSTMTAEIIEGILDGGAINSERDATRSIRVHGLLLGADVLAVEAGLTWLRNALRANACGMHGDLCGYHDLRYFLAKPAVCDPLWVTGYDEELSVDMGALDVETSPLVWQHGVEGQPHAYEWAFPAGGTDGVKITWGALAFDSGDVLEMHGPLYVQRSNFMLNPSFRNNTTSWSGTGGTISRVDTGVRTYGHADSNIPVTYRSNWLPDPSFEHGDPNLVGWRGDISDVVDGTAPQGTHVAVVPANPDGNWMEASMLGPYDDNVEGTFSFWKRHPQDIQVIVANNAGQVIFSEVLTGLADAWERVSIENVPMKRDYVIRIATAGAAEIRVDGLLLEDVSTMGTYFDGDTADDPGSETYYSFVPSPAGPSRESVGVFTSFSVQSALTDAPFDPVVLSFDMRAVLATPTVLVELLDPNDTVVGSVLVNPGPNWQRFALGVPFGRRVRARFSTNTGAFDIDETMIEATTEVLPYFDGDSVAPADYSLIWVGTPGNSVARMTWLGTTRIERSDNWRPQLTLLQGDLTQVRLDIEWSTDIAMEEQLEPYDRSYHRVSTTTGVKRIRDMQFDAGAAIEVDFVLTAATPHAFSTVPRTIEVDPGVPSAVSDELINMSTNPSGEAGTTGWTALPGTTGVAAVTNPTSTTAFGTKVLRATWSTASTAAGGGIESANLGAGHIAVGAKLSLYLGHIKSSINNRLRLIIGWYNDADLQIASTILTDFQVTAATVYERTVENIEVPSGATKFRVRVISATGTGYANWSIGSYLEVDGVMPLYGGTLSSDYFDGSRVDSDAYDYSWDGTVGLSTSRRTLHEVTQNPLIDPDLPVLPTPPAPPTIPDLAVDDQNEWLRYYVAIPAGDVALWAGTVPNLSISTITGDIRQVRVRFYPNPFGWDVDDLAIDDYCGEFILSYMPANSVLTVSGVTREAWAQVAGGAPQSANTLLYGTGGTPMDWPELSCAIPYVMTIDVPPGTDVDDLTFDLTVNLRE